MAKVSKRKRTRSQMEEDFSDSCSEYDPSQSDNSDDDAPIPTPTRTKRRQSDTSTVRATSTTTVSVVPPLEDIDSDEEKHGMTPSTPMKGGSINDYGYSDEEDDDDDDSNNWRGKCDKLQRKVDKLETENRSLQQTVGELQRQLAAKPPPPTKRRKQTTISTSSSSAAAPKSVNVEKYLKKWASMLPRKAKGKGQKFTGYASEVIVDDMIDRDEFKTIFEGKGILIQPKPDYKPKSIVTIQEFRSWEDVETLFGVDSKISKTAKMNHWTVGDIFRGKSRKIGTIEAVVDSLTVHYNRSRKMLQLKFQMMSGNSDECYGGRHMFFF